MTEPYAVAGHIRASLHGITDRYDEALSGTPPRDDSDAHTRRAEAPPPVSPHILDVRAETHHDLRFYALFVLEQVNGGSIATRVDGNSVTSLARFLDVWALALAEQHPADAEEARRDLGRHARALAAICNGDYTRRFAIPGGRCPEMVWRGEEMVRCSGTLVAVMRQGDILLPRFVGCDREAGHQWAPSEWLGLGRMLTA